MTTVAERIIFAFLFLSIFSSCSSPNLMEKNLSASHFLSLEKEIKPISGKLFEISSLPFNKNSKVIIWMHGTNRPSVAGNFNCTDDMPPESMMLAAQELDYSVYYLCSHEKDGTAQGSFIYKRVAELNETINLFNKAGVEHKNIFLAGFSAGGWTALMAAKILPGKFNKGILFAPAFAGPRYETYIFPVWRKIIRPKQVKEILKANELKFLIFAYEDDPFNRPKELEFLNDKERRYPEIVGYTCNEGHFTYRKDCKNEETYKRILDFFEDSDTSSLR